MRLVHRYQYIPEHMLFENLKENTLDFYAKKIHSEKARANA